MDYGTINPKDEIFLTRWGTTPYQILRAQQIIERLLPFLEQDVAARLAQAHGLLFSWTTALWGTPILLAETEDPSQNALGDRTQPEQEMQHVNGVATPTPSSQLPTQKASRLGSHASRKSS